MTFHLVDDRTDAVRTRTQRAGRWLALAVASVAGLAATGCGYDPYPAETVQMNPRQFGYPDGPVTRRPVVSRAVPDRATDSYRSSDPYLGPMADVRKPARSATRPTAVAAKDPVKAPARVEPTVPPTDVPPAVVRADPTHVEPTHVEPTPPPPVLPVDVKPVDPTPAEVRPAGVAAAEAKPADAKPTDPTPPEVKPADNTPEVAVGPAATPPGAAEVATPSAVAAAPTAVLIDPAVAAADGGRQAVRPPETLSPPVPSAAPVLSPERQRVRERVADLRRQLAARTLDPNERDARGRTLLQQAAIAGEFEVVEVLLDNGANVAAVDREGWTALHWAASGGHQEVAELLIASGARVDVQGTLGETPLYWAAVFDRKDVAELLIARGANVTATDRRGRTPLHAAAESDARATAVVLLAQGADAKAQDEAGATPLHAAVAACRKTLAELGDAHEKPADGDAAGDATPAAGRDSSAREAARQTAINRGRDMVRLLVEKGADVNASTRSGVTPLHLAAWDETRPLAELLVSLGAARDAKDTKARTPADYARQRNQHGVGTVLASGAR
ncbi:MAG TPA: ankyrin repeat domain-containing protein [Humisphaera sp.]